ncbi:hypothetical protein M127_1643 [Bacteroides fragilis str. S6L5]|nr:hypothetical protein M127_1643 [Bacteroides fragilis str. S6L5]
MAILSFTILKAKPTAGNIFLSCCVSQQKNIHPMYSFLITLYAIV